MLSLVFSLIFTCMISSWGGVCLSLVLVSLLSVLTMNQHFSSGMNMMFYNSNVSGLMVFLSVILCFLGILSTPNEKSQEYMLCISLLGGFLVLAFSMSNIIMFYIFFECSLIPTLMLIIGWGYQPERLQAGTYMMLYTVGASLPLLVVLSWRCYDGSSMSIMMLSMYKNFFSGSVLFLVYGAFLVKLPMYSTHLWLPKAHVEAPLAGSMILAGILLKLGGFGLMQVNKCFSLVMFSKVPIFLISVGMWGGLLAVFMCMRQVDVKALVAYSSVGHMGIVAAGILPDRSWGVSSAMITMVAHGFSSSALFCLAYFTYEKIHSRNIPYMKGVLQLYPILSLWWFIFCCINMAAPPSINLIGELMIVPSLLVSFMSLGLTMGLMVFFSAAYNMYLYTSVNHGSPSGYLTSGSCMRSYEKMSILMHFVPFLILFKSSVFMSLMVFY
uniref:NADH-ubiquinone oxidoreductase chain 4 n=1 Tax=Ascobulla fragilis TaxID=195875 RepID=B3DFC4_ASCFR|nr:NADH dehydrogenase subunit 4 [Ascobulla fragilis]ACE62811.1 NADH dehydrogenase subunit 4 [Ascobulla fragilis]